ncbi:hypothetical protein KIPB_010808, partial [Kipferlia bialata]
RSRSVLSFVGQSSRSGSRAGTAQSRARSGLGPADGRASADHLLNASKAVQDTAQASRDRASSVLGVGAEPPRRGYVVKSAQKTGWVNVRGTGKQPRKVIQRGLERFEGILAGAGTGDDLVGSATRLHMASDLLLADLTDAAGSFSSELAVALSTVREGVS